MCFFFIDKPDRLLIAKGELSHKQNKQKQFRTQKQRNRSMPKKRACYNVCFFLILLSKKMKNNIIKLIYN